MMCDSVTVRSVAAADFAQWQLLWQGYNRFYGRHALPMEITQRTWSRFFDPDEPVYAIVAEKSAQLVGLSDAAGLSGSRFESIVPLWQLLVLICVAAPVRTVVGVAQAAKAGYGGGYAVAITVGLAVGTCCAWTMSVARKLVRSRVSDSRYSLAQM